MTGELNNQEFEQALQKRVNEELKKIISDPHKVIEAYQKQLALVENKLEQDKPKVDFYDSVTMSDDWMEMSMAVKSIEWAGKPIGRNKMFELLREKGILRNGTFNRNEPYQKYVDMGYFRIVETKWDNPSGEIFIGRKTVVSQKGLEFMINIIRDIYNERN